MKKLKFKNFKAAWILDGTKTSTMRLFDDKDLNVGDELELEDSDTQTLFAHAVITTIIEKNLGDISDADLEGHETWNSHDEMLLSLRKYYGDKISDATPAKIVRFRLTDSF